MDDDAISIAVPTPAERPHNPAAEDAFLAEWSDDITRAARRGVRLAGAAWPTAEDVAQDVRIRVLRAFRLLSPPPEGYVRTVIKNTVNNVVSRPHGVFPDAVDPQALDAVVSPTWATDERSRNVRLWLIGLPQRLQQLYSLLYVQGATQREAARAMGVSQPRVAQLHRELLTLGREGFTSVAA